MNFAINSSKTTKDLKILPYPTLEDFIRLILRRAIFVLFNFRKLEIFHKQVFLISLDSKCLKIQIRRFL
mgnify:CR=1 FL=1